MKKLLLLLALIVLVGCASEPTPSNEPTTTPEVTESTTVETSDPKKDGYYYQVDSTSFTTGDNATSAMTALGNPLDTFKAPSCAFEGEDTVYKYDNLELYTYEKDGQPHISGIFLLDESAQTAEGLHIGSTVEEMKTLYGTDYEENVGSFVYTLGDTELIIVAMGEEIVSITYILKV